MNSLNSTSSRLRGLGSSVCISGILRYNVAQTEPALSVLDLVPVSAGRSRRDALREMIALARAADAAGYRRYWIAEHHGSTTYLAAATTVLMGQVLAATGRIGVASGGIY